MTDISESGSIGPSASVPRSTSESQGENTRDTASGFSDLADRAAEDMRQVRDAAKDQAQRTIEKTEEVAAEQKNFVAKQLGGVAEVLEKVGAELEQGEQHTVGRYAKDLGGSAKRLAADLKDRELGEVASMVEDFGRRQPVAFLGLAAMAGLAASRFITASAQRRTSNETEVANSADRFPGRSPSSAASNYTSYSEGPRNG